MLLFGLHVPKCAGTTLLMRAMMQMPFYEMYQCTSLERNFLENRSEFQHINDYSRIRLVFGHFVHEEMLKSFEGPVQLFTGLREPRARLKSALFFQAALRKRQGLPQEDMTRAIARRSNAMCRTIASSFPTLAGDGTLAERALRVLDHCFCVYFSERFEETAQPVYAALNIEPGTQNFNVGSYEQKIDGRQAEELDLSGADLEQDQILYETALERFAVPRPISAEAAERLEQLRLEPRRPVRLQRFYYSKSYGEYRDAGLLDRVIARRKSMIAELRAELAMYESLAEKQQAGSASD